MPTLTPAPLATLTLGTVEVDSWEPISELDQLSSIPALEHDLHLWDTGHLFAWLVELDTKYSHSEAINAPYAPSGSAIARFWPPTYADDEFMDEWQSYTPTELTVPLPPEGEWRLRVLSGRYDHYVVLTRSA